MMSDDLRKDLGVLLSRSGGMVDAAERAIETARTSGHDEILDHLERIRDVVGEQVQELRDQLEGELEPSVLRGERYPERLAGEEADSSRDGDVVDEASKESFPASDAPAY